VVHVAYRLICESFQKGHWWETDDKEVQSETFDFRYHSKRVANVSIRYNLEKMERNLLVDLLLCGKCETDSKELIEKMEFIMKREGFFSYIEQFRRKQLYEIKWERKKYYSQIEVKVYRSIKLMILLTLRKKVHKNLIEKLKFVINQPIERMSRDEKTTLAKI
jgi:hypothetical protein